MSGSSFNSSTGIGDLAGKVILVTGGNSGLGKETVLQLAHHQPSKIYLAARTESKAREAISSITTQLSTPVAIEWLPLDTSSFSSVHAAATTMTQTTTRLDLLILNAGIMATPPEKSASGHELQMATNHMGHFLLTKLLLPMLRRTAKQPDADVRVVSLSSAAQSLAPSIETVVDTEKLCATGPWTRYGASKAANVLFAAELARRCPEVISVSVHPGMIKTGLWKHDEQTSSWMQLYMSTVGWFFYVDTARGAYNTLWAAAGAKRSELANGGFYMPVGTLKAGNSYVKDVAAGKRLWDWTEGELAKSGF